MPIYHGFYSGFKSRHTWNEDKTVVLSLAHEESGESWITLFIDLVYVAMFMNVGYLIEYCGDNPKVVEVSFMVFVTMFVSRLAIDEYSNRFFADDIFHRLVYYVYTFGVFVMTLNINYTISDHHRRLYDSSFGDCIYVNEYWNGFAYGFLITRLSLILLYSMVCYNNKNAFNQFAIVVFRFSLSTIIVAIFLISQSEKLEVYNLAIALEVFFSMLPKLLGIFKDDFKLNVRTIPEIYPLDMFEYQNRLGIFYMMVLGESIIQLLQRVYSVDHVEDTYYFTA